MRKTIFSNNRIYHIYNRGVEKRKIFIDQFDNFHFIHDLFEFNDKMSAGGTYYYKKIEQNKSFETRRQRVENKRDLLVEILVFCLMPNHFHLILKQKKEGGIQQFMKKLGGGYAKYFNGKYKRVGPLFQGRFKAIEVDNESYLLQLSRYIHLNPIGLIEPKWKENGIGDRKRAEQFLENYRWSSYFDYIGGKNFPSLTSRDFLLSFFNNNHLVYKKFIQEWAIDDMDDLEDLIIEK